MPKRLLQYSRYKPAAYFSVIRRNEVTDWSRYIPGMSMQINIYQIFVYLQLLDLLTTLVGFKLGAAEASPFIRMLMHAGPVAGVAVSKLLAVGLGALCIYTKRQHLVR